MQIITRAVIQSVNDGEVVETFDTPEDERLEADQLLARYSAVFGEPLDLAYTRIESIDVPVNIGWVFAVPERFTVPGKYEDFELLLIPMITDSDDHTLVSLFVRLAEQRREFQHLHQTGVVDSFSVVTLPQRDLDDPR